MLTWKFIWEIRVKNRVYSKQELVIVFHNLIAIFFKQFPKFCSDITPNRIKQPTEKRLIWSDDCSLW